MLTLWAFSCICFFASLIYIFLQYVIPELWDKFQEKFGFKIGIYNFYKYQFEFSADKIRGDNKNFFVTNFGSIEKCNINVLRVFPKISWSRINKHWFTIEIQNFGLVIDSKKVKINKKKKKKVKKPKVKRPPNKLKKKINKILKGFINTVLNVEALHYILNNVIKNLFALRIKDVDIRYITPQNTLINYRQENLYIYSGIDPSSSVTVDSKHLKYQEFFIRVLISPFSINHYRNIKLLPNEKLVYDFSYYLTDSIFEHINRVAPLLMSEESTEFILKWTGKVNYRRNIELAININGFTTEINEIKNLLKIIKSPVSNNSYKSQEIFSSNITSSNNLDSDTKASQKLKLSKETLKSTDTNNSNEDIINYDTIETILDYLDALNIHLKFNINRLAINKTNNKLYALPSILVTLNKLSFETSLVSVPETERQIILDSTFEIYDFVVDLFNGKMSAIYLENNQMQLLRLPYFSTILNNSSIKDIRKLEDVFNFCSLFQVLIDSPEINICETYISMVLEEILGNKNVSNETMKRNTRSLSFSSGVSSIETMNEIPPEDNEKKSKPNPLSSMSNSQTKVLLTLLEYITIYSSIHIVNPSIKIRLSKNTVRSHLPKFPSHHFLIFASHIDEIYIKGIIHNIVSSQECHSYLEKLRANTIDKKGNNNRKRSSSIINSDESILYNILHSNLYEPDSNVNFNISFKNFYVDTKLIKQGDVYDFTYNNEKDLHTDKFQINLNVSLPNINRCGQIESTIPTIDDLRTDIILNFNMNELSINMANSLATTKYYLIFATSIMKWKTIINSHKNKGKPRANSLSSISGYGSRSRRNTFTSVYEKNIIKLEEETHIIQNEAQNKKNKKHNKKDKKILTLDEVLKMYVGNVKLSTDFFISKIGLSILDLYDTSGVNLEIFDTFLWLKLRHNKMNYLDSLNIEKLEKDKLNNLLITEQSGIPLLENTINSIEGNFSMKQICGYIQDISKWNEPENMHHRFLRLTHLKGNINNSKVESHAEKNDATIEDNGINIGVNLEKLEIFYSINIHYALFATFVSLTKWGSLIKSKINLPYVKHKRNLSYINNVNLTRKRKDSRVEHIVELESIPSTRYNEKIDSIPKKKSNIKFSLKINEFDGELELPNDIRLYIFIQNTCVNMDKNKDISVSINDVTAMVPPQIDGDRDFLSITKVTVKVYKKFDNIQSKSKLVVDVGGEKISMTVPFGYIVSDIIENGVNMFKATKQIAVRLINTVVNPVTHINPNKIPELNVYFDILLIIFLDQKFESKLGRNYKESFSEQISRLARDIAFNKKVEALKSVYQQEQLKKSYNDNRNMEDTGNNIIIDQYEERENIYVKQNLTKEQLNAINNSNDIDSNGNTTSTLTNSNLDLNYQQLEKRIDSIWYLLQEMNSKLWIKRINKLKNEKFKPMALGKMTNVIIRIRPPELLAPTVQETIHIIDNYCTKDARYALLVPMNIFISVSSFSINFRDYPIPFVDIPIIPNQPELPSLTLNGILIISEQEAFKESVRYVKVPVFPNTEPVHVSRTINPIKMYSRLKLTCSSPDRTFISWGFSIDPCLTDMIRVIDGFTKVNVDISENIIWWDKVRLNMHGRFGLDFVNGSNLHVRLLGSLSPYFDGLHHSGTDGIEFQFSKGASVTLGDTGIPNTQIYINCGEFKCVVPRAKYENVINPSESLLNKVIDQIDEETVVRFSGDVRLSVGFEFVPICDEYFDKPRKHNEIVLKVPQHATLYPNTKKFDSYAGFRSKEILVSLFIASPPPLFSALNYPLNSLHLSPFSLNHISSLMPYFSSPIGSLPIRIGKIFNVMLSRKRPASFKSVKLKAYLLPAVLGYVNGMNVNEGCVGLRIRSQNADISICWKKVDREIIDSENNDIVTKKDPSQNKKKQNSNNTPQFVTQKWVIQSSKITFTTVEGRTVGLGSWVKEMNKLNKNDELEEYDIEEEDNNNENDSDGETDESEWMTDYDFFCIRNNYPWKMEKFIWAPRVIYVKRKYESEPSSLLMSDDQLLEKEIKRTQLQLTQNRYLEIKQEIGKLLEVQNGIEVKLKALQGDLGVSDEEKSKNQKILLEQSMEVTSQINILLEKRNSLGNYLKNVNSNIYNNSNSNINVGGNSKRMSFIPSLDHNQSLVEKQSQFNYYYIIHNVKLIYKTSVRNTIFKLFDLRNQESAMSYFTSNALMKRIKQLLEVDDKKINGSMDSNGINDHNNQDDHITTQYYEQKLAQDLLNHLINEQYDNNIVPNELSSSDGHNTIHHKTMINNRNIMALDSYYPSRDPESPDYVPPNSTFFGSYVVHFLNPQINFELRSKINPNQYESAVLAAEAAQYKSIRIMDGRCNTQHFTSTLNHRLVKTRNILNVQNSQLFLTQKGEVEEILPEWDKYDSNNKPRVPWPLWCPLECLVIDQYSTSSYGYLSRVVEKISFSWHSARPNSLYINKPMDKNSMPHQSDSVNDDLVPTHHVMFPEFALTANSTQYSIIYNIIMDLIVYSEPAQRQRREKIQSMLLALGQLEDLSTILDSVQQLQNIIKSLDAKLKYGFWDEEEEESDNKNKIDDDNDDTKSNNNTIGRTYNYSVNNEKYMEICSQLLEAKEELYIVIEALKIYHTRNRNKYNMKISSRLIVSADKVYWTMIAGNNDKICQCDISTIVFETQSQEDQTSIKKVIINEILLINLMEDESSHFRKALSFYNPKNKKYDFNRHQMFRIYWREIAPVGGIAIVEHFEINMLPIELRLTYDLGRKLIFYVFPEKDKQSTHIYALNELTKRYNRKFGNSPNDNQNSNESLNDLMDNPSTENLKAEYINDEASASSSAVKDNEADTNPQENKSLDASSRNTSSENVSGMNNQNKTSIINKFKKTSGNQLTQMKTRASKNKTFIYIKVPSVQHCLSYKGSKTKNIVDLYDFTFRLPTLEFRNKTWTWLDLLMNVKKMVISTVLSHTGSLVKTKISQLRKGGNPYLESNKNELLTVPNSRYDNLKSIKSESDIFSMEKRKTKKSSSVDNYQEYHIEGNNIKFDIGININEINSNNDDIYGDDNTYIKEEEGSRKGDNERILERKPSSTSDISFNSTSSSNTYHNNGNVKLFDSEDFQKRLLLFGKFERERRYNNANNNSNSNNNNNN